MKKKALGIFLILVMAVALVLSGCSSKESGTSNNDKPKGDSKGEPYEITMAYIGGTNSEDLPLVQEAINKITKEKINATVKLMPIDFGAWVQQSTLLLTGNEKIDLMVTLNNYLVPATKGQLLPLDDLLAKHGKGILDVVPKHILEGTKVNGEIYGIPSIRDFAADFGFTMRKDIVDKYDIDLGQIKTFEDLENVFKIVKENEPNLTPVNNVGTLVQTGTIISSKNFDTLGDSLGVIPFNGGEIVNMFEHPDYVKAIELTRKWYEAGYILKDSVTISGLPDDIIKGGKGFGSFANMKPGFETQASLAIGMPMVAVRLTEPHLNTNAAIGLNMTIPRNSENPEKAMEFLNLLYTDKEIMNLLALGIEGEHYQLNSDGTAKLLLDSKYVFNEWEIGNNALTYPYEGNSPNYWDEVTEFNDSAVVSPAFGFQFNPDPVKTEIAACTNVINQYKAGLESGALDPEKTLPEFNKKLKASGIEKIIAEKQKQFDEWNKNK